MRTLGWYLKEATESLGSDSPAVTFLQNKIKDSPQGAAEPVLATESQMVDLLVNMHQMAKAGATGSSTPNLYNVTVKEPYCSDTYIIEHVPATSEYAAQEAAMKFLLAQGERHEHAGGYSYTAQRVLVYQQEVSS